jgi:hypothetical protein
MEISSQYGRNLGIRHQRRRGLNGVRSGLLADCNRKETGCRRCHCKTILRHATQVLNASQISRNHEFSHANAIVIVHPGGPHQISDAQYLALHSEDLRSPHQCYPGS